jgi:hypothetical protein
LWYVLFWLLNSVHTTCCLTTSETIWGVPEYQKNFIKKVKKYYFYFVVTLNNIVYLLIFGISPLFSGFFGKCTVYYINSSVPLFILTLLPHQKKASESQCDLNNDPSRVECPRLWGITKNSLHNEGIYKWVNLAPIFFDTNYFQLLLGLRCLPKSE